VYWSCIERGAAANANKITCATDFCNAVNTVSNDAVLGAMAERQSQLFPFARLAYLCPVELWVHGEPRGDELLWRTTGVRQGDLIVPLLIALSLQESHKNIVKDFPEVRVVASLEDVYIQSPQGEVA
jgi:hypothetical protein